MRSWNPWTTQRLQERIKQHVQKQSSKEPLLLRSKEPTDLNQPELSQIENVKQKVTLNPNQRVIQPFIRQHLLESN